jgi:hypothetical protein
MLNVKKIVLNNQDLIILFTSESFCLHFGYKQKKILVVAEKIFMFSIQDN